MRAAAEENRNSMLAACREDAEASITGLQVRSAAESETLRRVAANEITAIADYAKAEVERITVEADEAIAARRARLGQGLEEQTTRDDLAVDTIRSRVAAFEAAMTAFFGRLGQVADAGEFAALTAQLPEPPKLHDPDADLSAFMPGGSAYVAPMADAVKRQAPVNDTAVPAPPTAAGPAPAAAPTAAVAAEAAAPAARAESKEPAAPSRPVGEPMITTIVVAGLVNIASIAAFKRLVSGLRGVHSVAVSSGPGGEFVFKVTHEKGIALGDEVTLLPGFGARIVDSREGVLQVSARDPGAAA
ncbi:MAG: hypothetical protein ACRDF7_09280 [Candidatus Limnocylindrales bacterium]